ncbi:MAG: SGNH/GDSL hydrolase family protein [Gammaproteobacteria bacterium]|nr:MAG: SGNH/GDSL hydrolase family protein [Gammaproteobacteria bacterium]TDJ40125.1 MAG: SGNH/GDSL hydrolase family protein [Gammaproteobacteria bacterium]
MKTTLARYATTLLFIALITLALLKFVDLFVPSFLTQTTLFPPNQKVLYRTIDFDSVASINQFGFRGSETSLQQGQILTVGDSFTFGWGNKDHEVWSRLLEKSLGTAGIGKRIYNLGVPGTNTEFHIKVAHAYAERLKPSVLILSVLLSDDMQQVAESRANNRGMFSGIKKMLKAWFPGWYQLYVSRRNSAAKEPTLDATNSWANDAKKIINDNALEISDEIMRLVEAGQINPGLFSLAAKYPDRSSSFWSQLNVEGSNAQETFDELSYQLSELNLLLKEHGGRLILFSMPTGYYVRSKVSQNYSKYGFQVSEENFTTFTPEFALEKMAKETRSEFVPSLQSFRSTGEDYFYEYDGHLNPQGSVLVSNLLHEYLVKDRQD